MTSIQVKTAQDVRKCQNAALVGFAMGGAVGFVVFSVSALVIETIILPPFGTPGGAQATYGVQAVYVSVPSSIIAAGSLGAGVALLLFQRYWLAALTPAAVSLLLLAILVRLWGMVRGDIGADPSELVLFWPPVLIAAFVALGALVLLFIAIGITLLHANPWQREDASRSGSSANVKLSSHSLPPNP